METVTPATDPHEYLEAIKQEVKQQIRGLLVTHRELILKLGKAIEYTIPDRHRVCQEIKKILKEEVEDGLITKRVIEKHCLDEWKDIDKAGARKGKGQADEQRSSEASKQGIATASTTAATASQLGRPDAVTIPEKDIPIIDNKIRLEVPKDKQSQLIVCIRKSKELCYLWFDLEGHFLSAQADVDASRESEITSQ